MVTIDETNDLKPGNPLENENISKLLLKFAIPSVISMVVNALYNIVDQIFIGQGVGYLGNAATNVAFPLITIAMAIALMTGNGAAALYSLKLGAREEETASKTVGNAISMMIISGLGMLCMGLIFFKPLLYIFGATEAVMPYAIDYTRIIIIGLPFVITTVGLNAIIRADGSPKYSMYSMLIGAVINIILDPIFIFVFHMGVEGAAIATIIGQFVSLLFSLKYIRAFKSIKVTKDIFRLDKKIIGTIISFGASSFATQMAITLVQITINNTIRHYGALSIYGSDIPLSVIGIVMKVNMIIISIILGIAIGSQPIWGYNYGAKRYDRVKKTYKISVLIASVFSFAGLLVFQLFTQNVVNLFGSESLLYNEFAIKSFKIFLSGMFAVGFQIVSSIYFQAIGKPLKSAFLSMSRQAFLLAPLVVIMPMIFGIEGILYAGPMADIMSAVITSIFIIKEMKNLNIMQEEYNVV
ncbi:MAG: MATE family efflux transporter [Proteocatella sp.]